jgi:signal transduction histidine kinase
LTQTEHRERRRLAQMLHDDLQQLLVAAKMHLNLIPVVPGREDVRQGLKDVDNLLAQAVQSARSLTVELSPPILFEQRLVVAFGWLARHMQEKYGLEVTVHEDTEIESPDEDVRVLLFNAVRELLFNIVKHAGVHDARVALEPDGEHQIRVIVEDCGQVSIPRPCRTTCRREAGLGSSASASAWDCWGARCASTAARGVAAA